MTEQSPTSGSGDPPAPSRRFSDEEFAVILKRASEMQVRSGEAGGSAGPSARGLTLDEIRQIAAEAGIDARFVDQAVTGLPTSLDAQTNVFVGAPYAWDFQRTVRGRVAEQDLVRVIDALRSVMKEKGEVEDVYGTFEWSYDDSLGPVLVRVVGRDDETRIEVSARRSGEAGLWYGLAVPFGGILGGAALAGLLGVNGPEALVAVFAAGGVSWFGVRVLWRNISRHWERKLRTLTERVTEAAASVARLPPGAGDEGG